MTRFHYGMLAGAVAIIVIFAGTIAYSLKVAPRMALDSKLALNQFFSRCQKHDYEGAHQFISGSLSQDLTTVKIANVWQKFEKEHGPIRSWNPARSEAVRSFAGNVCVFPPFVDFRQQVYGQKGREILVYLRLHPEDGVWKIQRFNVLR